MRKSFKGLSVLSILVLLLTAVAFGQAQDATEEPTQEMTTEPMPEATMEATTEPMAEATNDQRRTVENPPPGPEKAQQRADRRARDELRLEPTSVEQRPRAGVAVAGPPSPAADHHQLAGRDLGLEALPVERDTLQEPRTLGAGLHGELRQDAHRPPERRFGESAW